MPPTAPNTDFEFQMYKSIFDNAEDMISYVDFTGKILDVNERTLKFFGCKREDLVGKFFFTLPYFRGSTVSLGQLISIFKNNLLKTGPVENRMELGLKNSKGELRFFDLLTGFVRVGNETKAVINIYRDITETKKQLDLVRRNELDLKERVKELKTLYDISKFLEEELPVVEMINKVINRIPIGLRFTDLAEVRLKFDGSEFKTSKFSDSQIKLEQKILLKEQKEGLLTVEYRSEPLERVYNDDFFYPEEGELIQSIADQISGYLNRVNYLKTLTERNKFIEVITDNLPIGISVISLDKGTTLYTNPKILEIFGWTKEEVPNIDDFFDLAYASKEDAIKYKKELYETVNDKNASLKTWEKELRTKSGVFKHLNIMVFPIREQNLLIAAIGDITDVKLREADITKRDELMQTINRFVGEFLSGKDWSEVIKEYLKLWGTLLDVNRAYIFEHFTKDSKSLFKQTYEWVSEGGYMSAFDDPGMQSFSFAESGVPEWEERLKKGQEVIGDLDKMTGAMKGVFEEQKIKTMVFVPIFVNNNLLGFIGFDECRNPRQWKLIEIQTLKTIAGVLGQVIENSYYEKEIKESNTKLQRTNAELEKFNKLMVGREVRMMDLKKRLSKYEKID